MVARDRDHSRSFLAAGLSVALIALPGVAGAEVTVGDELTPIGSQPAQVQRQDPGPTLVYLPEAAPRAAVPQDRYAMASGCYTLTTPDGSVVAKSAAGYTTSSDPADAEPFHFQATELGRYLLFDSDEQFMARTAGVTAADAPSPDAEWTIDQSDGGFVFTEGLTAEDGTLTTTAVSSFALALTDDCASWDEIEVDVTGPVFAGTSPLQEVRGYLDDHIHHMTQDFLGGSIHCGQPWHPYGVTYALADCSPLTTALPEAILNGSAPTEPGGWPTFQGWPAPNDLIHEGTYYKWVERAWRGGQRLWVNLLVENTVLCRLYPGTNTTCTDMDSIRLQAQQSRDFENYVDAQYGGPGKGWYRIVTTPSQARAVINEGKLAVVLGTESSELFGCSTYLDQPAPACTEQAIIDGLDELHELGVRQMVPTHKFDNAFSGVKGDGGTNGIVTNIGNFLQTGSFIRMQTCDDPQRADNPQLNPDALPAPLSDLLGDAFGIIADTNPLALALPLYPPAPQCNTRGMTELGYFMLNQMVEHHIIYDVDHMSSAGRADALTELERLGYSGVISSHTWSDATAYPRIYALGGMVNPYAGSSESFVDIWHDHTAVMDGRYYFGFGFGADMNGLGPQGGPRGADVANPVVYPFTDTFGSTIDQQVSGERVYDINVDGVAHYGLYPDWIEDLKMIAGTAIDDDLVRGPEAYLQMWERATGIANDACRQPELRRQVDEFTTIAAGTSSDDVLNGFGQPHLRRDSTYQYCALSGESEATVTVTFDGTVVAAVADTTGPDPAGTGTTPTGTDAVELGGGGTVSLAADGGDLPETGGPGFTHVLAGLLAIVLGTAIIATTRRLQESAHMRLG